MSLPQPFIDVWALWPDGFMVPISEVQHELWNHRSDDYMLVAVTEYDGTGEPSEYSRIQ